MAENAQEDTITLLDEDGVEHQFIIDEVVEVDEKSYFILLPEEGNDEEDDPEYLIFRVETVDGEDQLVLVDDDEELERVAAEWADMEEDEDWDSPES